MNDPKTNAMAANMTVPMNNPNCYARSVSHSCDFFILTRFLQLPFGTCSSPATSFDPPFSPFLAPGGFSPRSGVSLCWEEPFVVRGVAFGFAIV